MPSFSIYVWRDNYLITVVYFPTFNYMVFFVGSKCCNEMNRMHFNRFSGIYGTAINNESFTINFSPFLLYVTTAEEGFFFLWNGNVIFTLKLLGKFGNDSMRDFHPKMRFSSKKLSELAFLVAMYMHFN